MIFPTKSSKSCLSRQWHLCSVRIFSSFHFPKLPESQSLNSKKPKHDRYTAVRAIKALYHEPNGVNKALSIWHNLSVRHRNTFVLNTLMTLCLIQKAPFAIVSISNDLRPFILKNPQKSGYSNSESLALKLLLKCCRGSLSMSLYRDDAVLVVEEMISMTNWVEMEVSVKIALVDVLGEMMSFDDAKTAWMDTAVMIFESVSTEDLSIPMMGVMMKCDLKSRRFNECMQRFEEWLMMNQCPESIDILILYHLKAAKLSENEYHRQRVLSLIDDRKLINFENLKQHKMELINFMISFYGEMKLIDSAQRLFENLCALRTEDIVSVNSMMRCLVDNGMNTKAISLYNGYDGQRNRIRLDNASHVLVLGAMTNLVKGDRSKNTRTTHSNCNQAIDAKSKMVSLGRDLQYIVDGLLKGNDRVSGGQSVELMNALIVFFGSNCRWKQGDIGSAVVIFKRIQSGWNSNGERVDGEQMTVSIGSMMNALIANELYAEAIALYKEYRLYATNHVLGVLYLSAAMALNNQHLVMELMEDIEDDESGEFERVSFVNAVIECHGHFGKVDSTKTAFDSLMERETADMISLSSMMKCYLDHGMNADALLLYESSDDTLSRNEGATTLYLNGCTERKEFERGRRRMEQLMPSILKAPNQQCVEFMNSIISFYGECGDILSAEQVWKAINVVDRDEVTLSVMMKSYTNNGRYDRAIVLYEDDEMDNIRGDGALVFYLISCRKTGDLERGLKAIESMGITVDVSDAQIAPIFGLNHSVEALNAVISFLGHFGCIEAANALFVRLGGDDRDSVSINAMMNGFATNNRHKDALSSFYEHYVKLSSGGRQQFCYSVSIALRCCGQQMAIEEGQQIIDRLRFDGNEHLLCDSNVTASMIAMYAECGNFEEALRLIEDVDDKSNEPLMSAVIACFAKMGAVDSMLQKLRFYEETESRGGALLSDRIYCTTLTAAAHAGFVEEAIGIYERVKNRSKEKENKLIHPFLVNAFVDGLARSGQLELAFDELQSFCDRRRRIGKTGGILPHWTFTAEMLLSLLSSCRTHCDSKKGMIALQILIDLVAENSSAPEREMMPRQKVLDQIEFYQRVFDTERTSVNKERSVVAGDRLNRAPMAVDHKKLEDVNNSDSDFADLSPSPSKASGFNDKSFVTRLTIILSHDGYRRVLPLILLWVAAGYMPAVFFNAWGAEQFSTCTARTANDESCEFNYNEYNRYSSIFSSCGGLVAFMFGGLIGRISDSYGRKPIFYLNVLLSTLVYAPLAIWSNVWISFAFKIPAGLNSSDNSLVTFFSNVLCVITKLFVIVYLCSLPTDSNDDGGLFVGVGLAITLTLLSGNEANFIAIAILDMMQFVYLFFAVPESLIPSKRKQFNTRNLNPLRPLKHCCFYHPIVFWVAIVQFFISLPETGILDMALIYTLDQLSIHNETDANITNAIFVVSCSIGLIIGPMFILPKLQHANWNNIHILCVGVVLMFLSFIVFALLKWFKSIAIPIVAGVLITSGFVAFPAANGIVSRHLNASEQGIGFGVVFAVRALTWIIAPVLFAEVYSFSKTIDRPAMCMYMGSFIILLSLTIILWPLRRAVKEAEVYRKEYSFHSNGNSEELVMDDQDEDESQESMPLLIDGSQIQDL